VHHQLAKRCSVAAWVPTGPGRQAAQSALGYTQTYWKYWSAPMGDEGFVTFTGPQTRCF